MVANLSPTALTRDHYDDLNKYIAETFHTDKEYRQCALAILNFTKLVQDAEDKTATIKDINKRYLTKHGHDLLEEANLFQDIAKQGCGNGQFLMNTTRMTIKIQIMMKNHNISAILFSNFLA